MNAFFLLILAFAATQESDQALKQGQIVVTTESTPVSEKGKIIAHLDAGNSFPVQDINGQVLSINSATSGTIPVSKVIPLEQAEKYFEKKVQQSSDNPAILFALARVKFIIGKHDEAIRHFDAVLQLEPKNVNGYLARGIAQLRSKNVKKALDDFNLALAIAPQSLDAYRWRAAAHISAGNYELALKDYNQAVRIFPDYASVINDRAWMLATCPDESFRSGQRAVKDAEIAAKMSNWRAYNRLETLAAAHAENNDFENAVKWQKRAIELAPKANLEVLKARLLLFQAQHPYRESPLTMAK